MEQSAVTATYGDAPIAGTTVFTGARSQQGYRINKLAISTTRPENRAAFKADERGSKMKYGLREEEMILIERRDWSGLIRSRRQRLPAFEDRRYRRAEPSADGRRRCGPRLNRTSGRMQQDEAARAPRGLEEGKRNLR